MGRQIVISASAYARLCAAAAAARRESGRAVTFTEVLDSLLEGQ